MGNRAVFIDRDGTINQNVEYLSDPNNFKMHPGVAEGVGLLKKEGFKVIVVTNQSGIARGYFSIEDLERIHARMIAELATHGAVIDGIYYCPHHPDEGCDCRKPRTALFEKAIKDFEIHTASSFVIGDRMLDMEAGRNVGCKTILVPEDKERVREEMEDSTVTPDFVGEDFSSAVNWILECASL